MNQPGDMKETGDMNQPDDMKETGDMNQPDDMKEAGDMNQPGEMERSPWNITFVLLHRAGATGWLRHGRDLAGDHGARR